MPKLLLCMLISFTLFSCKKNGQKGTAIDVSHQVYYDNLGNVLLSDGGISRGYTFNSNEMAFFNSLDTANLNGTIRPATVNVFCCYPNPTYVTRGDKIGFNFGASSTSHVVVKYVIVDSVSTPLLKKVTHLYIPAGTYTAYDNIDPASLPVGRFRVYLTLSAESNDNFYTLWNNIERRN